MNYYIEMDKFHRIIFKKYYIFKLEPKDTTLINLLGTYLSLACKSYPTEVEFSKFLASGYDMKYRVIPSHVGKYRTLCFSLSATDPKYINDPSYNLEFLNDTFEKCLEPVIVDNSFDKRLFNKATEIIESNLLYKSDCYEVTARVNAIHELFKDSPRDYEYFDNLDFLAKITKNKLYKSYLNLVNEKNVCYICGNDVNKLKKDEPADITQFDNYYFEKRSEHSSFIVEKNDKNQAYIEVLYDLKSFSDSPLFYSYAFINYAFGFSGESILFTMIREKFGLCYSIYSEHQGASGIIRVATSVDKRNIKLTLEKIDECFESLLDYVDIEHIRRCFIVQALSKNDVQDSYISESFFPSYFKNYNSLESEISKINEVTIESIKEAYKNMEKTLTYIYGGEDNE